MAIWMTTCDPRGRRMAAAACDAAAPRIPVRTHLQQQCDGDRAAATARRRPGRPAPADVLRRHPARGRPSKRRSTEVIEARIYSGIHFRTSDDVGARLGRTGRPLRHDPRAAPAEWVVEELNGRPLLLPGDALDQAVEQDDIGVTVADRCEDRSAVGRPRDASGNENGAVAEIGHLLPSAVFG